MIQILIFLPILRFSGTSLHEVLNSFFVVLSLHFFIAHVKNSDHFVGLQYHFLQYRSRFVIILEVLEKAVTYDDVKFFVNIKFLRISTQKIETRHERASNVY